MTPSATHSFKKFTKFAILPDYMHPQMLCLILQPRQKSKEWVTEGVAFDPHDFNLESKKIHSACTQNKKKI